MVRRVLFSCVTKQSRKGIFTVLLDLLSKLDVSILFVTVSRNGPLLWIKFHLTHENKRLLFSTSLINIRLESAKMTYYQRKIVGFFLLLATLLEVECGHLFSSQLFTKVKVFLYGFLPTSR